jgi:hypothetical protein
MSKGYLVHKLSAYIGLVSRFEVNKNEANHMSKESRGERQHPMVNGLPYPAGNHGDQLFISVRDGRNLA